MQTAPDQIIRGVLIQVARRAPAAAQRHHRRSALLLRSGAGRGRAGLAAGTHPLAWLAAAAGRVLALRRDRRGEQGGLGSKVIVLKALGGDAKRPFFAVLTQGFPRLVTVTDTALLRHRSDDADCREGVLARVRLNDDDALVPDLAASKRGSARCSPPRPEARRWSPARVRQPRSPCSGLQGRDRGDARGFGAQHARPQPQAVEAGRDAAARGRCGDQPPSGPIASVHALRRGPARVATATPRRPDRGCSRSHLGATPPAPAPAAAACATSGTRARPLCSQADDHHAAPVRQALVGALRRRASLRCAR